MSRDRSRSRFPAGRWPGCHVAHNEADWILGVDDFDADLNVDISIDPDGVLTATNASDRPRCFFLSLPPLRGCFGAKGRLDPGRARNTDGVEQAMIMFVLVVRPRTVMDVCRVKGLHKYSSLNVQSDVFDLIATPTPPIHPRVYGFPLGLSGPFLCSQGSGGQLTHFAHPSTYHAIDLECAVGTPVLSICEGIVKDVADSVTVSGVDVRNFFRWNHVVVAHVDGTIAEYVHIRAGSVLVSVGESVRRGQQLCSSGDAGFCPTPHLHLELHVEEGKDAPSVPIFFESRCGAFRCEEGVRYSTEGTVDQKSLFRN